MGIKNRILELTKKLNQHNINYYVYENPTVSDSKYDILLKELESLEKKYPEYGSPTSPTKRVGNQPLSNIQSINHRLPMLSLANAMHKKELAEFHSQILRLLNSDKNI